MIKIDKDTEDRIRRIHERTGLDPGKIVAYSVLKTEDWFYTLCEPEDKPLVPDNIKGIFNFLVEGIKTLIGE